MNIEILVGISIIALVASNVAWLVLFLKRERDHDEKEQLLWNRIQRPTFMTPLPTKKGESTEEKPRVIADRLFDPEYSAVGKVNPDGVDAARNNG